MRLPRLTSVALFAALLPAPACHDASPSPSSTRGNGVTKTDSRDLAAFDTIEIDGSLILEVGGQSPGIQVSLSGDENLLPLISTTVTGTKLTIHPTTVITPKAPLIVSVHVPSLSRIDVKGATVVHAKSIRADSFTFTSNGAADADLSGSAGKLEIDLEGAGSIRAGTLRAKEAHVTVNGAGSVEVNASDALKADVTGVGSVRYHGSPSTFEKKVTGLGSVTPLG
jgi:hypothetical protein